MLPEQMAQSQELRSELSKQAWQKLRKAARRCAPWILLSRQGLDATADVRRKWQCVVQFLLRKSSLIRLWQIQPLQIQLHGFPLLGLRSEPTPSRLLWPRASSLSRQIGGSA